MKIAQWAQRFGSFLARCYRIIRETIFGFIRNDDYLKASALTFYTLVSIVPFLALAFGIASGFGFENYLEEELKQTFDEQQEVIGYAIKFAHSLLQNVRGSVMAGVGLIALFWTNISMLNNIENALNDIWKVRQPRSWSKKLGEYFAVMIICPLFFVLSSSLSIYLIAEIAQTAKENRIVEFISPYILLLYQAVPFVLSILLFMVVYLFIPNVRVQAKPRIFSGIVAGIAFQLWQWAYFKFQVELSNYNAVYGTFAALPLFLIWLQVSWLIVLAGAELAAHIEHDPSYLSSGPPTQKKEVSQKVVALLILHRCIRAFTHGAPAPTAFEIARDLGLPLPIAQEILYIMIEENLLLEVIIQGSSKIGYHPSRDAKLYTIRDVCNAVEKHMSWQVPVEISSTLKQIQNSLETFDETLKDSPANLTMLQLNFPR